MTKKVFIKGIMYEVYYVPKEEIYPAFGFSYRNIAVVRQDLSPRVKKFVEAHELYHCIDTATWGGWIGRELRANFFPMCKDPIGFLATVFTTIFNIDRLLFYVERFQKKH